MIASLQSVGVNIIYDALMKRVPRASMEDSITEIRLPNMLTESVVSSLSPHKQSDYSLISENMADSTSHEDPPLETPELNLVLEVGTEAQRPRRSKTRKPNLNAQMPLFRSNSRQHNAIKSVGGKVEYG